jgi:hypothetical protein
VLLDTALAIDPVRLAERSGLIPDPWQTDLLRTTAAEMILLCSRQAGKSTISSVLAVHEANYGPPAPTLVLSPSLRQSKELHRKIRERCQLLGRDVVGIETENTLELELANGSRIICLPGKEETVRGFSGVRLLIVDEASRVSDLLYQAVRPMLAVSGGRIILLSTPFGKRGFFYKEWTDGGLSWHRVRITADQCPRISATWLEQEHMRIGDWWYRQEYGCEFVDVDDAVFRSEDIDAALDPDVMPLYGLSVAA